MQSRLALRALALCALLPLAGRAAAGVDPKTALATSFRSRGKAQPLVVDKAHVAVRHLAAAPGGRPAFLTEREDAAFDQLGVDLVERDRVHGDEVIVGYPVWFDQAKGAVGILTNEIVVRLDAAAEPYAIERLAGFATLTEAGWRKGLFLAKFTSPMAALDAANALAGRAGVRYAHPNFLLPKVFRDAPGDDPLFDRQWHLENTGQLGGVAGADIHVKGAWDVTTGAATTLVAILDGGFELAHPDLAGLWFRNTREIPGNGVDDDGNGYVDDVTGWNFWSKSPDTGTGVLDDHGTPVAGLLGARRNGKGMTGVCPDCTVLPVVVAWEAAEDAAAFYYAAQLGAQVISNSWGYPVGTPTTDVVVEAIETVAREGREGKGTVILFAMNNIDQDDCAGANPDISALDAVIAVSAASDQDKKVTVSAWGPCMEILSPSYETDRPGIATTDLTGKRGYNNGRYPGDLADLDYTGAFGGTSAATPIAAGVFALMLSVNDGLTRDEALAIVEATADKIQPAVARYDATTGFSRKYGYGRINAAKAVRAAEAFKKYTRREREGGAARTSRL